MRFSFLNFKSIANMTDMDLPYQSAGTSFSQSTTRSTARRLRRTRQRLGTYRHSLMVAMRVVNSVEEETMKAEWENWLLDENTRCKQVEMMLVHNKSTSAASLKKSLSREEQEEAEAKERGRQSTLENISKWQDEYCGSCRREQEALLDARRGGPFHRQTL